jgi:hypothetical protein
VGRSQPEFAIQGPDLRHVAHRGSGVRRAAHDGAVAAWQAPIQVSGAETPGTAIGGDIKINGAGDVFVSGRRTAAASTT